MQQPNCILCEQQLLHNQDTCLVEYITLQTNIIKSQLWITTNLCSTKPQSQSTQSLSTVKLYMEL